MTMAPTSPLFLPRTALTLIEILVVITIIVILVGLLVPALAAAKQKANRTQAAERVNQLHWALQNYAAEDRRHRYPPQTAVADFSIRYDPTNVNPGNFNGLIALGHKVDLVDFDRNAPAPHPLIDPWGQPYQYRVDDDLVTLHTAQRPLPLDAWNTAGVRPWAYVWSTGQQNTADGAGWIYRRDDK